ncbi:tail tubular protein A [Vibrio phage Phriendly]|nr:tail tubular protein A [Vibrio phage Phriendly]
MYANFKELEDAVINWTDREDIRPYAKDFIRLVTMKAARQLRVPTMERTQVVNLYADGSAQVPTDLVELISMDFLVTKSKDDSSGDEEILRRHSLKMSSIYEYKDSVDKYLESGIPSIPEKFAREGSMFKLFPMPSYSEDLVNGYTGSLDIVGVVEVHYYALPNTFNLDTDTNWLLQVAPEVYLYGALAHAYEFVRDYETAAFWNARMENSISEVQAWSIRADEMGGLWEVPLGRF